MRTELLDILRCPYCGGRLTLEDSMFHTRERDEVHDGILGCHCCTFPVIAGIPVLHLLPAATAARDHVEAGQPGLAMRAMLGLEGGASAGRFEALAASPAATYREIVEALGPTFEGGYFLYRFSDPTYVVAHAVVRALAGTVLGGRRRAIDICGGSGHLTRSLLGLSSPDPVLADLYFAKVWLARRFTVPGCEAVCCDGNAPLPFARGVFGLAMCSDAFQYIWTKRQFVGEMTRVVAGAEPGAVVINHTHNQREWTPSQGQPLPPEGYVDLFETLESRVFGETALLDDVVKGGPLDLTRREPPEVLDHEQALTIVGSSRADVFAAHPLEPPAAPRGELRISPLYEVRADGDRLTLTLRFPSEDYADEYGACRQYLPESLTLAREEMTAIEAGRLSGRLGDLARRRVIVDLPRKYY